MLTRAIPSTDEAIPAIGLGTWQTFDIGAGERERAPLRQVLGDFLAAGGRAIDSSPMYGRAESVVGELRGPAPAFLATKVWTQGREAGARQIEDSFRRLRADRVDLLQIHNLLDWRTHLATLRALKAEGRARYIGITHYTARALDELADIVEAEPLDFVQLPYSIGMRAAEKRLLPLCAERGVATLINRPFEEGALFRRVRGRPAPPAEFGCAGWGAFLLRFILAHPAVTCVIPATADPRHLADNLAAGAAPAPDAALARRMAAFWDSA
jgi:aryl-alcohol dehydrogenase-like predicted oxidoreductase